MPDLVIGSPPRGEDYFGRQAVVEGLWDRLRKDNVLLAAPRRFGKTGLMYQLLDQPRAPFRPLYIDVEDITSAADFMVELIAVLLRDDYFGRKMRELRAGAKGFGRFLAQLPTSIDIGGLKIELRERTAVATDWQSYGEQVMGLLAKEGPTLLLLIDEFADMISAIEKQRPDEAARFLRWFRKARIAPETRTRFVIGSSVNLISTLDSMGLVDTVNDLWEEKLHPFSRETAERYIATILGSKGIESTPEIEQSILDTLGTPIPYLLAVLLKAILDRQRASGKEIDSAMARAALENDLLSGATSAVFHHYRSRLDEYYTSLEAKAAKAILGTLSRAEERVQRTTLYQRYLAATGLDPNEKQSEDFLQLMTKLENDFYISIRGDGYEFYSRVLRLWWKARFGFHED